MDSYHIPVMLEEVLDALAIKADGVYCDLTYGGGGHSEKIIDRLESNGKLYAFDQDLDAFDHQNDDERLILVKSNFRYFDRYLRLYKEEGVDGILADLGVSSHQLDVPDRGFSHQADALLDMRMNQESDFTARDLLAEYREEELLRIFSEYGEIRNSRTLAKHIVNARRNSKIETVEQLLRVVQPMIKGNEKKYLSQLFQALRMEVNDEDGALKEMLERAAKVLKPGGRLVVLSYHSKEDRLVKNIMKTRNVKGEVVKNEFGVIERPFKLIIKKPQKPTEEEVLRNVRSRSALLRIGEKIGDQ